MVSLVKGFGIQSTGKVRKLFVQELVLSCAPLCPFFFFFFVKEHGYRLPLLSTFPLQKDISSAIYIYLEMRLKLYFLKIYLFIFIKNYFFIFLNSSNILILKIIFKK
jgi:hypothetical protein